MVDKKALLLAAIDASTPHKEMHELSHDLVPILGVDHPEELNPDVVQVDEVSENRFATFVNRKTKAGEVEKIVTAEYQVWTDEEAESFGYHPKKGALKTTDSAYKVYRII